MWHAIRIVEGASRDFNIILGLVVPTSVRVAPHSESNKSTVVLPYVYIMVEIILILQVMTVSTSRASKSSLPDGWGYYDSKSSDIEHSKNHKLPAFPMPDVITTFCSFCLQAFIPVTVPCQSLHFNSYWSFTERILFTLLLSSLYLFIADAIPLTQYPWPSHICNITMATSSWHSTLLE